MLCDVLENEKIICLYLSREERDDEQLRKELKPYYKNWSDAGYKVAVLLSGNGDIVEDTTRLLRYNRDLLARNEVRKEMSKANRKRSSSRDER